MTTIIRRYRRRHAAPPISALVMLFVLLALAAWVLMVIWKKGGPQPVHDIVIAIPAPQMPPASGRRA